ncbi:MAG: hypothetical protein Q7V63_05525 [Gammaproteobacteria bacterium]|nr:hypothetical protein [Gammaproteobacteria bacterium]
MWHLRYEPLGRYWEKPLSFEYGGSLNSDGKLKKIHCSPDIIGAFRNSVREFQSDPRILAHIFPSLYGYANIYEKEECVYCYSIMAILQRLPVVLTAANYDDICGLIVLSSQAKRYFSQYSQAKLINAEMQKILQKISTGESVDIHQRDLLPSLWQRLCNSISRLWQSPPIVNNETPTTPENQAPLLPPLSRGRSTAEKVLLPKARTHRTAPRHNTIPTVPQPEPEPARAGAGEPKATVSATKMSLQEAFYKLGLRNIKVDEISKSDREATVKAANKAFTRLAVKYHPDKSGKTEQYDVIEHARTIINKTLTEAEPFVFEEPEASPPAYEPPTTAIPHPSAKTPFYDAKYTATASYYETLTPTEENRLLATILIAQYLLNVAEFGNPEDAFINLPQEGCSANEKELYIQCYLLLAFVNSQLIKEEVLVGCARYILELADPTLVERMVYELEQQSSSSPTI